MNKALAKNKIAKKPHKQQHEVCLHFQFGKNENKLVDETKENRQNHSTFSSKYILLLCSSTLRFYGVSAPEFIDQNLTQLCVYGQTMYVQFLKHDCRSVFFLSCLVCETRQWQPTLNNNGKKNVESGLRALQATLKHRLPCITTYTLEWEKSGCCCDCFLLSLLLLLVVVVHLPLVLLLYAVHTMYGMYTDYNLLDIFVSKQYAWR